MKLLRRLLSDRNAVRHAEYARNLTVQVRAPVTA
jgi:hypothetical protein